MNIKSIFKAVGKACLYFGIYFGWQLMITNWAAIIASVIVSVRMAADPSGALSETIGAAAESVSPDAFAAVYDAAYSATMEQALNLVMEWSLALTLLSGVLTLITLWLIFRVRKKSLVREVALTKLAPSQYIIVFALGAALNLFVSLVMNLIPFPEAWMADYLESSSLIAETSVLAWITAVLCAPIVEEVVFRGLCYTRLKQGMPMFAAMLISAWAFGMVHGTIIWMLYASLFGFILAWLYEKYRSLTACIVMHLSFNLFGQLMTLLTEIPDAAFWLLLAAGGIASAALLLHIEKQSPHKIEFTMPEAPAEGENNNG